MKKAIVPMALLIAGAALGYWIGGRNRVAVSSATDDERPAARALADKGEAASLKALRQRIAALERELAAARSVASLPTNAPGGAAIAQGPNGGRPFGPDGFRAHMEELKKSDPARYSEITNRMAQWRQRRAERQQAKMEFLASIDTSRMGSKAKQTHDDLQEALARREEIEQRLHDESLTDEQRHAAFDEMRSIDRQIDKLNRQERKNLIAETAKSLGFKGEDVQEISATMNDIIDATDGGRRGPGGPPPSGGRPPAGGPGPM